MLLEMSSKGITVAKEVEQSEEREAGEGGGMKRLGAAVVRVRSEDGRDGREWRRSRQNHTR